MLKKYLSQVLALTLVLILLTGCGNLDNKPVSTGTPDNSNISVPAASNTQLLPTETHSNMPSATPADEASPLVYQIDSINLDGDLSEWSSLKPIAEDPPDDSANIGADILSLYAVKDSKYLYVAVSLKGGDSSINFNVDCNNDGLLEYSFNYEPDARKLFIFKTEDGKPVLVNGYTDVAQKQGVEIRIPLDAFDGSDDFRISALTNTGKPDYKVCDEMQGWFSIPACDETIACILSGTPANDNTVNPGKGGSSGSETGKPGTLDQPSNNDFKRTLDTSALGMLQISCGWDHTLLLKSDGSVWGWGNNEFGQIGNGSHGAGTFDTYDNIVTSPQKIMDGLKQIGNSYNNSFALKTDGSLWGWGKGLDWWFGDDTINNDIPTKVADNVRFVTSGLSNHIMFIKNDNSLWGTGANNAGQLGIGNAAKANGVVKIMDGVKMAALGESHSAILKLDGSLWTLGSNDYGQLGDGTFKSKSTPVKVLDDVKYVVCGSYGCYAIKNDDSLWAWGFNRCGEAGVGEKGKISTPTKVLDQVAYVAATVDSTFAVRYDATLWGWGDGTDIGKEHQYESPVKIMDNVKYVAAGLDHMLAVKTDNTVWAWGKNIAGQLGTGDTKNRSMPVNVMTLD